MIPNHQLPHLGIRNSNFRAPLTGFMGSAVKREVLSKYVLPSSLHSVVTSVRYHHHSLYPSLLRLLPIRFVHFGILRYMRACFPTHHTLLLLVTFLLSDHHPYTLFPFTVSMSWVIVHSDLLV